jgi:hypothetical protein
MGTLDEHHFDRVFSADAKGLLFTVQKALPLRSWTAASWRSEGTSLQP